MTGYLAMILIALVSLIGVVCVAGFFVKLMFILCRQVEKESDRESFSK